MKIQCPDCKSSVPSDQVNMGTDLAFCEPCDNAFRISETIDLDSVSKDSLMEPPKGAWFIDEVDRVVVGASTRSAVAFFLVPFMCVWSGGSLGGIYGSQIVKGEFDLTMSLFGIPFVLGSLIFWALALMAIWGKVEVTIGNDSTIFTGIGSIGWTRRFDWSSVRTIREDTTRVQYPGSQQAAIVMEGKGRIKFGSALNEPRRYFVLNALKHLKAENR